MRASKPLTLLLAVTAGITLWAAFPDTGWWPLTVIAVALLHEAWQRDHAGWNALVGYCAGIAFFLPHTWWAAEAATVPPWLALTLVLQAPFFALAGALWTWARRLPAVTTRTPLYVLTFAAVFTSAEQWRSRVPFGGFPWGRLAWSVADAPTGRAAWLAGSVLVTALLAVGGVLLTRAVEYGIQRDILASGICLGAMGIALFAPALLPLPSSNKAEPVANPAVTVVVDHGDRAVPVNGGTDLAEAGTLTVGIVQGGNANPGGDASYNAQQVLDNHRTGTRELIATGVDFDLMVWPEDSAGWDPALPRNAALAQSLDALSLQAGAPLLIGTQEFPQEGGRYNVMLLWNAGEGIIGRYAKQRPVPFGEYIPLRPLLERLSDQVARVSTDMIAAENAPVIEVPVTQRVDSNSTAPQGTVTLGMGICFEVAYDDIFVDAIRHGAEVLIIPTNNASFGITPQSTQQLQMTRMQAIATGRATVQVSTVGVSGVISPDGTLVARTGLMSADHVIAEVPLRTTVTPAVTLGLWPGWMALALGPLLAACGGIVGHVRRTPRAATVASS
ncbi:MAG: apolipoprotein N-acyltransferase [Cellulomonadaceae bacterium]|jgi:apolipoprotein N-acyltransferase|nr:apolipoprotein N-acyltransferase [Cellulomonadaceae bacterium]